MIPAEAGPIMLFLVERWELARPLLIAIFVAYLLLVFIAVRWVWRRLHR